MSESKNKICKFPKCKKEIPSDKGMFCSYHKKSVKEKGKLVGKSAVAIASVAGAAVFTVIGKKD